MNAAPRRLPSLALIGAGRVGTALFTALASAGVEVELHAARALPPHLDRAAYLLAVRDPQIAPVAQALLARHQGPPPILLHTAGSMPSAILREAGARSAAVLHPLVAFSKGHAPRLEGALFAVEGEGEARELALALVACLKGRAHLLDAARLAAYHAAAALASNHVLALVDLAREVFEQVGIDPPLAAAGLASVFGAVAENLAETGLPQALTGPVARGDDQAVRRHLEALRASPEASAAYLATLGRLCAVARRKGEADPEGLLAIEALLALYATPDLD